MQNDKKEETYTWYKIHVKMLFVKLGKTKNFIFLLLRFVGASW